MNKDDIYQRISVILQETYEIEPERISPDAKLYDDLDIDSIDAVDLIAKMRSITGQRLQPEAFKSVRTVQDVVDALYAIVHG